MSLASARGGPGSLSPRAAGIVAVGQYSSVAGSSAMAAGSGHGGMAAGVRSGSVGSYTEALQLQVGSQPGSYSSNSGLTEQQRRGRVDRMAHAPLPHTGPGF